MDDNDSVSTDKCHLNKNCKHTTSRATHVSNSSSICPDDAADTRLFLRIRDTHEVHLLLGPIH